jgi:hypothetical protein
MIHNMLYTMLYYMICNMLTFMCCQAGHLPPLSPLNADYASMFNASEHIIQDHVRKYKTKAAELKDIIQEVLYHPGFDVCQVDMNMHERLMPVRCLEAGDIDVIDLWEEGNGIQPVQLYKRPDMKVLWELLADERLAGLQHFAFKEYKNARGDCILAYDTNGSLSFQLAQIDTGPGKVSISIVLYINWTFIKCCIPI